MSEQAPLLAGATSKRSATRAIAASVAILAVVALAGVVVTVSQAIQVELVARRSLKATEPADVKVHQPKVHYIKPKKAQALACEDTTESATIVPDEWVAEHNAYRREVGAPDVIWSDAIAAVAQKWADLIAAGDCQNIEHSTSEWRQNEYGSSLGENIAMKWSSAGAPVENGKSITTQWTSEKAVFVYGPSSDLCTEPNGDVGHYTQVVWAKTEKIGCGQVTCGNLALWICQYDPPGNFMGQLPFAKTNVPAGMDSCPQDKIDAATGSAPPCHEPAGTCAEDGAACCSCCDGASEPGAVCPAPPAPEAGTGVNGEDCSTFGNQATCTASRCCASGFSCIQYSSSFAMCLDPNVNWTMCPNTNKFPQGAGPWSCAKIPEDDPSAPAVPCTNDPASWCA